MSSVFLTNIICWLTDYPQLQLNLVLNYSFDAERSVTDAYIELIESCTRASDTNIGISTLFYRFTLFYQFVVRCCCSNCWIRGAAELYVVATNLEDQTADVTLETKVTPGINFCYFSNLAIYPTSYHVSHVGLTARPSDHLLTRMER